MRLEWTEPALADLEALRDYIAQDSPVNAVRFIERLFKTADKLVDHPRLGREVAEANDTSEDIREQTFSGYRILYRVLSDRVQVIAVVDGTRDLAGANNKPGTKVPIKPGSDRNVRQTSDQQGTTAAWENGRKMSKSYDR